MRKHNLNSKEDQKKIESAAELREAMKKEAVQKMMQSEGGRMFFWDILYSSGLFANTQMTGNNTTFYNLGSRDLAFRLFEELEKVNFDLTSVMRKENIDD